MWTSRRPLRLPLLSSTNGEERPGQSPWDNNTTYNNGLALFSLSIV